MASDITDEMIETAAEQIYGGPVHRFKVVDDEIVEYTVTWSEVVEKVGPEEREIYLRKARRILQAALAGRTVIEAPEPQQVREDATIWLAEARRIAASVDGTGHPFVLIDSQVWLVGEAEAVGLAMVAAAREARRLAGSVGSETPEGDPS